MTPTSSGSVTFNIAAGVATDGASNENTAAPPQTVEIDIDAPGITLTAPNDPPVGDVDVTISFTETVNGFEQSDLTITPVTGDATVTALTVNTANTNYTATLTPVSNGEVTLTIAAGAVTDVAGNPNAAVSTTVNVVAFALVVPPDPPDAAFSTTPTPTTTFPLHPNSPDLAITVPEGVQYGAFDVTFTFTWAVTDFTADDLYLNGTASATLSALETTDNIVWTVTITPTSNGWLGVSVPSGVAADAQGRGNFSENTREIIVSSDGTSGETPEVSITVPEGSQSGAFDVTVTFTEAVTGFTMDDISFHMYSKPAASVTNFTETTAGTIFTVTITPTAGSGLVLIWVPAGVAVDGDSNGNAASKFGWIPVNLPVSTPPTTTLPEDLLEGRTPAVKVAIRLACPTPAGKLTLADLAAIRTLEVQNRGLTALKAGDFEGLTGLRYLYLHNNALTALPEGIFNDNTHLKYLTLYNNALTTLPKGVFANNTSLQWIYLQNNALTTTLPADTFGGLTVLTTLSLNGNDLTALPEGIFDGLTALKRLSLYNNDMATLPADAFDGLTALTYLSIWDNELTALPEGIFDELTALETIYLDFNKLDEDGVPAGIFKNLTALEKLSISGNEFTVVPDGFFEGLTLPGLWMAHNPYSWYEENGVTYRGPHQSNRPPALELIVTLEADGTDGFKAVAPAGAPFDIVLPLTIVSGTIDGGATSVTIPQGSLESEVLTVTYNQGQTSATVNIGDLPTVPPVDKHVGYGGITLVKSDLLPVVIGELETDPDPPGGAAAPSVANLIGPETLKSLDLETLEAKLATLRAESDGSLRYLRAIQLLESRLAALRPDKTLLLANYPNPFNPETWIPYQLANPSDVVLTIYNMRGIVVRRLDLGHQREGYYTTRDRAAYWDGRNDIGERVTSGIYFYHLQADNVSLLRKMVILK